MSGMRLLNTRAVAAGHKQLLTRAATQLMQMAHHGKAVSLKASAALSESAIQPLQAVLVQGIH